MCPLLSLQCLLLSTWYLFGGALQIHNEGGMIASIMGSPRPPSMGRMPSHSDLPAEDFKAFHKYLDELSQYGLGGERRHESALKEVEESAKIRRVVVEDLGKTMFINASGIDARLAGLWWWPDHPTFPNVVTSMFATTARFRGWHYDSPPGMVSPSSLTQPLALAVPSGLHEPLLLRLADFKLDFIFELPATGPNLTRGQGYAINTRMAWPFNKFPVPAALEEGFKPKSPHWNHDHKDKAKCFCSVYAPGQPDVLVQHRFGKEAYWGYRIVDGYRGKTDKWDRFISQVGADSIETFMIPVV